MNTLLKLVVVFSVVSCTFAGDSRYTRYRQDRGKKIRVSMNTLSPITPSSGPANASPRVFGGSEAQEGQFPYMVFHIFSSTQNLRTNAVTCSAGLVKPGLVLIAAHCYEENMNPDARGVIMVAGRADLRDYIATRMSMPFADTINEVSYGVQERRAYQVSIHPEYGVSDKVHDIALVHVGNEFIIGGYVKVLPVSFAQMTSRTACTIHGWGLSENNVRSYKLQYAEVYVMPVDECQYKSSGDFICVEQGKRGICQGDSGSPLVCYDQAWGVASHLVAYEQNPNCGEDFEEYYAEIYSNLNWLRHAVLTSVPVDDPEPGAAGLVSVSNLLVLCVFVIVRLS